MTALWLALASLFPLLNPFAALPLFSQLTSQMDRSTRNRTARTAAIAVLVILIVAVVVWIVLRFGQPLLARLGTTGIGVLTRVFGLIILAIAVQLVAEGATQLFPALKGASTA